MDFKNFNVKEMLVKFPIKIIAMTIAFIIVGGFIIAITGIDGGNSKGTLKTVEQFIENYNKVAEEKQFNSRIELTDTENEDTIVYEISEGMNLFIERDRENDRIYSVDLFAETLDNEERFADFTINMMLIMESMYPHLSDEEREDIILSGDKIGLNNLLRGYSASGGYSLTDDSFGRDRIEVNINSLGDFSFRITNISLEP